MLVLHTFTKICAGAAHMLTFVFAPENAALKPDQLQLNQKTLKKISICIQTTIQIHQNVQTNITDTKGRSTQETSRRGSRIALRGWSDVLLHSNEETYIGKLSYLINTRENRTRREPLRQKKAQDVEHIRYMCYQKQQRASFVVVMEHYRQRQNFELYLVLGMLLVFVVLSPEYLV